MTFCVVVYPRHLNGKLQSVVIQINDKENPYKLWYIFKILWTEMITIYRSQRDVGRLRWLAHSTQRNTTSISVTLRPDL